ncbi:hypothetical protein Q7P37_010130 [Cladosporium fusiforme]
MLLPAAQGLTALRPQSLKPAAAIRVSADCETDSTTQSASLPARSLCVTTGPRGRNDLAPRSNIHQQDATSSLPVSHGIDLDGASIGRSYKSNFPLTTTSAIIGAAA